MDMRADEAVDEAGARWLTHAELAALRGISTASAIKLALRHRWRKQKDNRGTLRCLVPPEWATGKDKRDDGADAGADTSAAINALQAAMDTLLEAKDSEIAGLKEAFEIALSAKDSEIASACVSNSSAGWRIWMPSAAGRTSCAAVSMISAANSPTPRPSWPLPRTKSRLLTQAEAERRARGVLARLRAAWRGE